MPAFLDTPWILAERPEPSTVSLCLRGTWDSARGREMPVWEDFAKTLVAGGTFKKIIFKADGLEKWDSTLPSFVLRTCELAKQKEAETDLSGLPKAAHQIIDLALAVPEKEGAARTEKKHSPLYRLGETGIALWEKIDETLAFVGETAISSWNACLGKARFRWCDVWFIIQKCGPEALPIVTLISFLVGMILAYVGVVQLQQFGATIYVANLVGIAMMREMGAIMTGVIMSGRTGAAFAAELGSMKVSEEISAFRTFGISPYEFLIFPRILAVVVMMPLLVVYADLMGILGGGLVAISMGLTPLQYSTQVINSLNLAEFSAGLIKSVVFGGIIGITGCLRGMQCGNSSESVGRVTTSAVVTAITWIIVADAVFAVLFNIFGL